MLYSADYSSLKSPETAQFTELAIVREQICSTYGAGSFHIFRDPLCNTRIAEGEA